MKEKDWRRDANLLVGVLCAYGLLRKIFPIMPFLTPYLIEFKNVTGAQLYGDVYPVWTYTYLLLLIPVLLLSDPLRHRPLVVLESACYVGTCLLMSFGESIAALKLMEIVYAGATAAEVGYWAYVYASVEKNRYKMATSAIRTAVLIGSCISNGLAQTLISTMVANYQTLAYVSLGSAVVRTVLAVALPPVLKGTPVKRTDRWSMTIFVRSLWGDIRECYGNRWVLRWSIYWALSTCGYFQVVNYVQNLWVVISMERSKLMNAVVAMGATLSSALLSFLFQYIPVDWAKTGELIGAVAAAMQAASLYGMAAAVHLPVAYVLYVVLCTLYNFMIAVSTYNVMAEMASERRGLVFGMNTFLALFLQTLLTIVVTDARGLHLPIRHQFLVYSSYYGVVTFIFGVSGVLTLVAARRKRKALCAEEENDADKSKPSSATLTTDVDENETTC